MDDYSSETNDMMAILKSVFLDAWDGMGLDILARFTHPYGADIRGGSLH